MNKGLIAVNQDPVSQQALCFGIDGCHGPVYSYVTTLQDGAKAIVVTNFLSQTSEPFFFNLNDIDLTLTGSQ